MSKKAHSPILKKAASIWTTFGPGLVTGAADDDPSGVATYSQAGAQIGPSILWTLPLTWPFMSAIQMISSQIGRVTGRGLAANMRKFYGRRVTLALVVLLLAANIFNLGADISAMGAAAKLIVGGPERVYAVVFALLSAGLQIFVPYQRYANILKWFTFVLFAYVGVIFFVKIPVGQVLLGTFVPTLALDKASLTTFVALLGTTISPYLFFWQASQEVEEVRSHRHSHALRGHPEDAPRVLRWIRRDTLLGMGFSNIVSYFIVLATAVTLHAHGVTNIETADQAAQALRPIAGSLCFLLFALGILGTGLLSVPVLAGSAAFAVGETFRFRTGLEHKPLQAKRFYGVIAVATLLGIVLIYLHLDPIKALYWSAVINGVISATIMVFIMLMAQRPSIMGQFTISRVWRWFGWAATAIMAGAVVIFFITL